MTSLHRIGRLLGSLLLVCSVPAWAGGPRNVTSGGSAVRWTTSPISVDLESDLDVRTKDVTPLVEDALRAWEDLTESAVTISSDSLGTVVDNSNVCTYFYDSSACPSGPTEDGTNPLVIDEDGAITARFFGTGNKFTVLGFASIISFNTSSGAALKGEAVFNATCLNGVEVQPGCTTAGGLSFSDADFTSFIVHEIGHFLGLDHSQVNLTEATDDDDDNNDLINTMFPTFIIGNGANFKTPEKDDKVGLANLYPAADFASTTWTITGTVFDDDDLELQCANIVARNVTNPRVDAVAAISGDFSPAGTEDGSYEINGLTPGASYTVDVEPIDADSTGASGYTPCRGSSSGEPDPPQFTKRTSTTTFSKGANETESGVNSFSTGLVVNGDPTPSASSGGCSLIPIP